MGWQKGWNGEIVLSGRGLGATYMSVGSGKYLWDFDLFNFILFYYYETYILYVRISTLLSFQYQKGGMSCPLFF